MPVFPTLRPLAALLAIARDASTQITGEVHVTDLTDATARKFFKEHRHDLILLEFYSPWCGHCKRFAPEYEAAAELLATAKKKVKLARVDATAEEGLARAYKIQAYPTLLAVRNGGAINTPLYEGRLTKEGVMTYVKQRLSTGWQELDDEQELRDFLGGPAEVKVVAHMDEDDPQAKEFKEAAETIGPDNDWLAMALTRTPGPHHIVLYREASDHDEGEVHLNAPTAGHLMLWMLHHRKPFLATMDPARFGRWLGRGHLGLLVVRRGAPMDAEVEELRGAAEKAQVHLPISCAPFWFGLLDMDADDPVAEEIRWHANNLGRNNPVEFAVVSRGEAQGDYPATVMDMPFEATYIEDHIEKYCNGDFTRAKMHENQRKAAAEKVLSNYPVLHAMICVWPAICSVLGLVTLLIWYKCCARPFYVRLVCGRRTSDKDE